MLAAWRTSRTEGSHRRTIILALLVVAFAGLAVGAAPMPARGADEPACPELDRSRVCADSRGPDRPGGHRADDPHRRSSRLRRRDGGQAPAGEDVRDENDGLVDVLNLKGVPAPQGIATVTLDRVARGRRIEAQALVQTGTPSRTYVLDDSATSMLRPDLVVARVQAPSQTLTTRPVDVVAEVAEVEGDTAATAHVTLASAIGPLAGPVDVTVPAGGTSRSRSRASSLSTPATTGAEGHRRRTRTPAEYDATNESRRRTVEVTKNELVPPQLLVPSLGGYGFQFNGHLYAPITNPPPATLPDLESKVKALEPQLVRIFYNENWEANADKTHPEWAQNLESFKDTVAARAGVRRDRRDRVSDVATAKTQPDALDGALRGRPAGPRRHARADERALGPRSGTSRTRRR